MEGVSVLTPIDHERERLHRFAKRWGLCDQRTIRQSQKVDRLIYWFMLAKQRKQTF